jgi:UDP-glucose 4-epimerase
MKQKVLITGASGFVGYHLIVEALKNDLEVFAAVRKSSKVNHLQNLGIQFTYLDFESPEALKANFEANKYDYVIHAAGSLRARTVEEYNRVNADYTYNLGTAAADAGCKKFVMISSLAGVGPLDDINGVLTEDSELHPITAYGKSKILAEERLKSVPGLNYTILRPTAVYGPRDKDIFIFLKQVSKGFEPYIGKIEQKLTFIYVTDLAAAALLALHAGDGQTYTIADGNAYSRYELGNLTKEILKVKTLKIHIPVTFVIMIAKIAEKVGSLSNKAPVINTEKLNELKAVNWSCSIDKAKRELGFAPAYDLRAGLTVAFSWYKSNNWL